MKAIRLYGSRGSERVVLDEIPMPKLGAGEVLIRVHATAVTPGELQWYPTWHTPKGDPRLHPVPSHEFSGLIEEVAPGVTGSEKGDVVYGLNNRFIDGAAAEYCIATPAEMAPKLKLSITYRLPSCRFQDSQLWQALFEHGKLEAGQKVLHFHFCVVADAKVRRLSNGISVSGLTNERHFLRMPLHRAQRKRREQRSTYRNPMKAAFQGTVARVFSW
jgi:alcohol dehydrogenase-like protein